MTELLLRAPPLTLAISSVRAATAQEWDAIWQVCDYATYFHSREWAEAWKVYSQGGTRPHGRLVQFSDSKRVLLPLSAMTVYRGLACQYVSSPAGTYGGWISADELSVDHARLLTDYLTRSLGNLVWRVNPYDPLHADLPRGVAVPDETQALDLLQGFEHIRRQWTKGHASAARKASRLGVVITPARTTEDWRVYYRLYEATLRRWKTGRSSQYAWPLFDALSATHSPYVRLWLATRNQQVLAGALCFYAKRHVVYWHGAALAEHFHLRPVHLLMANAIEDACARGYAWFDFNPSGGHAGVRAFKASFAPEARDCPVLTIERRSFVMLRRLRALLRATPSPA